MFGENNVPSRSMYQMFVMQHDVACRCHARAIALKRSSKVPGACHQSRLLASIALIVLHFVSKCAPNISPDKATCSVWNGVDRCLRA